MSLTIILRPLACFVIDMVEFIVFCDRQIDLKVIPLVS